jgi:tetratricopeptide (TPR) repeat protein
MHRTLLIAPVMWLALTTQAVAFHQAPVIREALVRAGDQLLNQDLAGADATCRILLAHPSGTAAGRFCLGLIIATRAESADDPAPDQRRFLDEAAAAQEAAEAMERATPQDPEIKLLLGSILGGKAMVHSGRGNYLAALGELKDAHRYFEDARRLDPDLVDAGYGLGLYQIALGDLPALLKPLTSLVLPRGDPGQGLKMLEEVAERGTLFKMAARVALLYIYIAPSVRRYADALRLGEDLIRRYPGNPDLYFATALAASESGRFDHALDIGRRVNERIAEGQRGFTLDLLPRYEHLMGKLYMDQGEDAMALGFFQQAIQAPTRPRLRWITALAWARSGMIYDRRGEREEAVRRYRAALGVESGSVGQDLARRYLETPYRGRPEHS